jgi:hypothetical protein
MPLWCQSCGGCSIGEAKGGIGSTKRGQAATLTKGTLQLTSAFSGLRVH